MFGLLISVFALSTVRAQQPGDTLLAQPQPFADETQAQLPMPEDVPAVEGYALNGTGIQATGLHADKYGVYLERVDLTKCQHYKNYLPYFYGGLVINSRAWKVTGGDEKFTSMAILKSDGSIISSSSGAWPTQNQKMYHTWEMLKFGTTFQDIRTTNPGTLKIQAWNAGQQIYIPLYMADLAGGRAYMLHIYPEPSFLAYPDVYTYEDGLLYAKGSKSNMLFKVDIDVAGLIRGLDNFSVPNYQDFIKAQGVVKTSASTSQADVVYLDSNQISVHGPSQSSATEFICQDSVNTMDMTWTQVKEVLDRELTWLQ